MNQVQTPMMTQFYSCKKQAKGALLFFRLGDFYECFHDDAIALANAINVTLTKRHDIPMSGIPVQTLETHLHTLIKKNFIVAIAEQVESSCEQKGLIQRKVVRIVSPATYYETSRLQSKNIFFASLYQVNCMIGLCLIDVSTSECFVLEEQSIDVILDEIYKRGPKELLLTKTFQSQYKEKLSILCSNLEIKLHLQENYQFDYESNYKSLTNKFDINSLDTFGLKGKTAGINACGALMNYLTDELCQDLSNIEKIETLRSHEFLALDQSSLINLEILPKKESKGVSLFEHINHCQTPMGSRLIQNWLVHPLVNLEKIQQRQSAVETLLFDSDLFNAIGETLKPVKDVERFVNRIKSNIICPRDLYALASSMLEIDKLQKLLEKQSSQLLKECKLYVETILDPCKKVLASLNESSPIKTNEGGIFKKGVIKKVDELNDLKSNAKEYLVSLQDRLRKEIGIKSLKVNFNNAFGYFIQVPRAQGSKMPESFEKKQSLVNNERFVCQELKDYEHKILSSQERIIALEKEHFEQLKGEFLTIAEYLRKAAKAIAKIDALKSLALIAKQNNYTKPTLNNSHDLIVEKGRHALIEKIDKKENFISNDTHLNHNEQRLHLVTGPNMGGKSTYIRQVALIVILAQIGSFIPAQKALIGLVDKIFSRIGANDDLARGQSTFMVEMSETANILHNATDKSLVILDEIGRGTSTLDGIAIAKAVSEYLYQKGCRTLFATHYFELSSLEKTHRGIKNFQASVKETDEGVIFLHKILKGSANKSYGIHVAKLSGLPKQVVQNAKIILHELTHSNPNSIKSKQDQLTFFEKPSENHKILETIKLMDLDQITPLKALASLVKFQKALTD